MITKICLLCHKKFKVKLSRKEKAKYCSRKCADLVRKGHHFSPSTEFKKGDIPHNKRLYTPLIICPTCHTLTPKFDSHRNVRKFCSRQCFIKYVTGRPKSASHRKNIKKNHSRYWLGKENPIARQLAKKYLKPYQSGKNHWNWKGGITPKIRSLRNIKKYNKWRKAVFERDNYTCQMCGQRGGKLVVHHKISFAKLVYENNLKELFNLDLGITLCQKCHLSTDSYARRFQGTHHSKTLL
jgi:5-methylcytosine-specific restriction endonuclease McrA